MKLESDSQGFLIGASIAGADGVKLLQDIRGDTGRILAVMLRNGQMRGGRPAAVEPARRPMVAPARDAAGRFMAADRAPASSGARAASAPGAARASTPANRPMESVAEAVAGLAATQELQRREAKADARLQTRDSRGRFGSGGERSRFGALGELASSLGRGSGDGPDGVAQVDPMLQALSEARGIASAAAGVVSPIGRTIGGIMSRGDDDSPRGPTGLLRRLWREIRGLRKEQKEGDRALISGVKDAASGSDGGGILGFVARFLLPVLLPLFATAASAIAGWFTGGALYKWFTELDIGGRIGKAWDTLTGYISSTWDAGMKLLSDTFEPARKWLTALGDWVMGLPGVKTAVDTAKSAGAAVARVAEPVIARGKELAGKAYQGAKDFAGRGLGAVSAMFESGKQGAAAVSTGKGDFGGASYGKHQLASRTGTLQKFLASSGYAKDFAGMEPGSPEFNAKWKEMSKNGAFNEAQQGFIKATHYDPQMAKLKKGGIDLSGRGEAVQEAVYSTSVQFGGNTSLIQKALKGQDVSKLSDADLVTAIQDYKAANNDSLFKSSSAAVRAGTLSRAQREKEVLLSRIGTPGVAPVPGLPPAPQLAMASVPEAPPAPAEAQSLRSAATTAAPAPAAAPTVPNQDVPDRGIAYIVSGGLNSGGFVHR